MKVLFFGTPQIAVPFLEQLIQHEDVVGVVCRPDEPVGRGYELTAPPTKVAAAKNSIPVFQPKGPWTPEMIASFKKLNADIGIVVAYGRLLPESVFSTPRLGCVNLHFSLLPKYRGAAPMQWSLINGETETGVTAFWLEAGLDSGPIAVQDKISIAADDHIETLRAKLVASGLKVLDKLLNDVKNGEIKKVPQTGATTPAPQLKKEDGQIDWGKPAASIVNRIRGVREWPGAFTFTGGEKKMRLKILSATAVKSASASAAPGTVTAMEKNKGFAIKASDGDVLLLEVQPEGKKAMSAAAYWQGAHLKIGDKLL